jgi:hypothetical protein
MEVINEDDFFLPMMTLTLWLTSLRLLMCSLHLLLYAMTKGPWSLLSKRMGRKSKIIRPGPLPMAQGKALGFKAMLAKL